MDWKKIKAEDVAVAFLLAFLFISILYLLIKQFI